MKRAELEHILRACKGKTGETEFIVVGTKPSSENFPTRRRSGFAGLN